MKVAQCTTVHFKKGGAGRLPLARRADRNTLLNRAHRLASEILLGNPKTELLDCLMMANPTHNQIVTCLWRTREEKAATIETLRRYMREQGTVATASWARPGWPATREARAFVGLM